MPAGDENEHGDREEHDDRHGPQRVQEGRPAPVDVCCIRVATILTGEDHRGLTLEDAAPEPDQPLLLWAFEQRRHPTATR